MKLGIIQGRLLEPVSGKIQEFPEDWKLEFEIASRSDIQHIEWLVTKDSFDNNPIFYEDCSSYNISSICADNLVDERFVSKDFLDKNLDPICSAALRQNIGFITIPLLEDSDITDKDSRNKFTEHILEYGNKYPTLNFSFEAETHWDNILELVNLRDNFWITYDTGNITSEGFSHEKYIEATHNKINNVHLKDRTHDGQTVTPLAGDTDFLTIFNTLRKVKYDGLYTLQTARGSCGAEKETIANHKTLFEGINNNEKNN
jgi:hypothetical protein